ncbi:MAG: DUF4432 family protein [Lachnospiraceae bacterium]
MEIRSRHSSTRSLQIGLCIRFEKSVIPYLTQWKSPAAGDFAMALEPTNCGFDGRAGTTEILKAI